jgi:hypothetical protein
LKPSNRRIRKSEKQTRTVQIPCSRFQRRKKTASIRQARVRHRDDILQYMVVVPKCHWALQPTIFKICFSSSKVMRPFNSNNSFKIKWLN